MPTDVHYDTAIDAEYVDKEKGANVVKASLRAERTPEPTAGATRRCARLLIMIGLTTRKCPRYRNEVSVNNGCVGVREPQEYATGKVHCNHACEKPHNDGVPNAAAEPREGRAAPQEEVIVHDGASRAGRMKRHKERDKVQQREE